MCFGKLPPAKVLWPGCVKLGGILAAFGVVTLFITILVAHGNATLTANATVFYILCMIIFAGCAVSALYAVRWGSLNAAATFTLASVALIIVAGAFLIADLAVPECENNVFYLWHCDPGEKQEALKLVALDIGIITVIVIFAYAGIAHRRIIRDRIVNARREGIPRGDDIVALSDEAQDGSEEGV